ncbi:MAG: O-antigen ligase family protein [Terriglobia bacterium]
MGLVLAYAVFAWGGVLGTDQYRYLLALGLLAVAVSLFRPRRQWAPPPSRVVRWCVALLPAYVLMQAVPLPVWLVRALSPARAEALAALERIGARVNLTSLSVSPAATFRSFLLVCGYVIVFLLARELAWRFADRRWLAVWPIIAIAALEAALGLAQNFGRGVDQPQWGTYINHNHYAGFLEMALPFAVVYPVALWRRTRSQTPSAVAPALAACAVWALAGLIFAAIVFSFSRMGFIAAVSSLFVMGALALETRRLGWAAQSRKRRTAALGLVAALVLAGCVFLPPDKLIARFAQLVSTDPTGEGRAQLWAETMPLIKAYPAFGCGLGAYETAFMRLKVSAPLVTDDFAHNDYLQLLAELGLVGFAIGAALAFSTVRTAVRKAVGSRDSEARYFAVACAGALAAILAHSLADFNLYIPANAMLLAWIAGMTAGARELPLFNCRLTTEAAAIPVYQSAIANQQSEISNYRR